MVNRGDVPAASPDGHLLTRRSVVQGLAALLAPVVYRSRTQAAAQTVQQPGLKNVTELAPYDSAILPPGIRSRFVNNGNGLRMHVLEAGSVGDGRPRVLLLHGFPELAYSWRGVMPALADAGYHVIAPDQRGYGRTQGAMRATTATGAPAAFSIWWPTRSACSRRWACSACTRWWVTTSARRWRRGAR